MKKNLLWMLSASVSALLLCACAEKPTESGSIAETTRPAETQAITTEEAAVSEEDSAVTEPEAPSADLPVMTLRADSDRNYTLILQNDSDTEWIYGADFHIYAAGNREFIPFKEGIAVNALAYCLRAHSIKEIPIDIDYYYDDLPDGEYRIEMQLFNDKSTEQSYELDISTPFTRP